MSLVTKASLQHMLENSSAEKQAQIIGRACLAIFNRQTRSEQSKDATEVYNGIGFTGADAYSGSLTAKYFLKHGTLQEWQVARWMKRNKNATMRIAKYWKQLDEIAQEKMAKKAA